MCRIGLIAKSYDKYLSGLGTAMRNRLLFAPLFIVLATSYGTPPDTSNEVLSFLSPAIDTSQMPTPAVTAPATKTFIPSPSPTATKTATPTYTATPPKTPNPIPAPLGGGPGQKAYSAGDIYLMNSDGRAFDITANHIL